MGIVPKPSRFSGGQIIFAIGRLVPIRDCCLLQELSCVKYLSSRVSSCQFLQPTISIWNRNTTFQVKPHSSSAPKLLIVPARSQSLVNHGSQLIMHFAKAYGRDLFSTHERSLYGQEAFGGNWQLYMLLILFPGTICANYTCPSFRAFPFQSRIMCK